MAPPKIRIIPIGRAIKDSIPCILLKNLIRFLLACSSYQVEQLHGGLYSQRDLCNPLFLFLLAFVKTRDLPFAPFVLDMPLHALSSLTIVFQLLPSSSQLILGCREGFWGPFSKGTPFPIYFQLACILARLVWFLLARSCSTLAFKYLID